MLSIIVCTKDQHKFNRLQSSISATVGGEYELLKYNQLMKGGGICRAYNEMAEKSNYDFLCFIHDDINFHSFGWGELVIAHLKQKDTGVIGVMGGRYKSANGLTWRDGNTNMHRYQVKDGQEAGQLLLHNPHGEMRSRVLCLDGAFLCCRKEVWQQHRFDQKTFTGFHFYDADFCMQVAKSYSNYVVYDILIEHFSQGLVNRAFIEDSFKFEHKWKNDLPFTIDKLMDKEIVQLEGYTLSEKLKCMKGAGFKPSERGTLIKRYFNRFGNLYHLIRSSYFGILK